MSVIYYGKNAPPGAYSAVENKRITLKSAKTQWMNGKIRNEAERSNQ